MPFSHGHALLIGVGTYQFAPGMNVPVTVHDAQALAEILKNPEFCGYPEANVSLLHNADATKQGVLAALTDLADRTKADDTTVLFYCGHGDYGDDGNYYLTTHNTRIDKRRVVSGTGVSQQELIAKIKALPARRILLIFNACHSGEVSPTLGTGDTLADTTLPEETAGALLNTGEGRVIITACREGQLSYIGNGNLTIFTEALIDGLRGRGVANRRGYISSFDLYTATFDTVSETVVERYNKQQEPELTILKGVGSMAVALYRGATTLGEFEAPAEPEQRPTVRQVSPRQSERYFNQIMVGYLQFGDRTQINTGGGAFVRGNFSTGGGDFVGRDKTVPGDEVRGDKVSVGDVSRSQGVAIGRGAGANVTVGSIGGETKVDAGQLRAALEKLWDALDQTELPRDQKRIATNAASNAIDSIEDDKVNGAAVVENVKKVGETLKQAHTVINEGSSLWQSVQKLAPLLGPLVGGARVIFSWFGLAI